MGRPENKVSDRGSQAEATLQSRPSGIRDDNYGIAGDRSAETLPNFIQTSGEKVLQTGDSYIVLGRDRPGNQLSGKGGEGATGAHSIDIVVGRAAASPLIKRSEEELYCHPDFQRDAARIHISQKTDIDTNFNLTMGPPGPLTKSNRSGIGIKADLVRVVAREGIKIVSGVDPANSQNARVSEASGVELIAYGQDFEDGLQPLVKGKNLLEALNTLTKEVDSLAGIVADLLLWQTDLNTAVHTHTHNLLLPPIPFTGGGTGGPVSGVTAPGPFGTAVTNGGVFASGLSTLTNHAQHSTVGLATLRTNLVLLRQKYFEDLGSDRHINSKHHMAT